MPDHPNRFAIKQPVLFRTADSRVPEWTEGTVKTVEAYTESRRKDHYGIYDNETHAPDCDGMYYTITDKNHTDYNAICICEDTVSEVGDPQRWTEQMIADLQEYQLCWIDHAMAGRPLTAVPQPGNDRVALFSGDSLAAYAHIDDILAWAVGLERHPAHESKQLDT